MATKRKKKGPKPLFFLGDVPADGLPFRLAEDPDRDRDRVIDHEERREEDAALKAFDGLEAELLFGEHDARPGLQRIEDEISPEDINDHESKGEHRLLRCVDA